MTTPSTEPDITAGVELVKPATAQEWLEANTTNRRIRDRLVAAYARDMAAGKWQLSGEAVKFAANGQLLDGQHRLHAVIKADTAVWMLVVRGLAADTQAVMDSGAARTAGDALRLHGEPYYSALAAAARAALQYEAGRVSSENSKFTHTEILEFIEANPNIRYAVELACGWRIQIDIPQSVLSLAIWRLYRVSVDDCMKFFSRLANKTELHAGDPVLALINRLSEVRRSNRRLDRADYLSLVFRAWNYWRTGKTVQSLPIGTRGGSVDIPQPK